jgi:hypothetical protein
MLPRLDAAQFDMAAGMCDVFLDGIGWSGCNTTLEALARDTRPLCSSEWELRGIRRDRWRN